MNGKSDHDRMNDAITRDTRVQLAVVIALCGSAGLFSWRWAQLESKITSLEHNVAELRITSINGTRDRWTSEMQAEFEMRIADDLDFIRSRQEQMERRLDAVELHITSEHPTFTRPR
ncbi:MAG: hypothetical protein ACYTF7_11335 [Planctomycetota bacterium]|jgi:hypothetical protein